MSATNGTVTIEEASRTFSAHDLFIYFLKLGIPYAVTLLGAWAALHFGLHYRLDRSKSGLAKCWRCSPASFATAVKVLPLLMVFLLVAAPLGLLLAWGIVVGVNLPPSIVGVAIVFAGVVLMMGGYAVALWHNQSWRMTKVALVALVATLLMCCIFEITITLLVTPFSYISLAAVFVSFNAIPMIFLVYDNASDKRVDFDSYMKTQSIPDPSAKLADSADLVVSLGVSRKVRSIGAYLLALGFLIANAAICAVNIKWAEGGVPLAGVWTLVAIVVLDIILYLCRHAGMLQNPVIMSGLLVLTRAALVLAGDRTFFVGHCVVFLLASVVMSLSLVDRILPAAVFGTDAQRAAVQAPLAQLHDIVDTTAGAALVTDSKDKFSPLDGWVPSGFQPLIKRREFILGFLTIAFVIDLIIVATAGRDIPQVKFVDTSHLQYLVGVASVIIAFIVPLVGVSYRHYQRNQYELSRNVMLSLLATEIFVVGSGVFFYLVSGSYIILMCSIFAPLIVMSVAAGYAQWVANDYVVFSEPSERTGTSMFIVAFFKRELPRKDYMITLWTFLTIAFSVSLGVSIASLDSPLIGWTICAGVLIPLLTFMPIKKYFNHFVLDAFVGFTSLFAQVLLFLYCILMYSLFNALKIDWASLGILLVAVLYPSLTLMGVSLYRWRDDQWKGSKFVKVGMGISLAAILGVILAILFVYSVIVGLGLLFFYLVIVYFLALGALWVNNKFYLPNKYLYSVLALLIITIGIGVAVGIIHKIAFAGFSVSWGAVFVFLCLWSIYDAFVDRNRRFQFSRYIFPVYQYNPDNDKIMMRNTPIVVAYGGLAMGFIWGIVAGIFMRPFFIGFGIASLFLVLIVWFTLHLLSKPSVEFGAVLRYVDAGIIKTAREAAANAHFGAHQGDDKHQGVQQQQQAKTPRQPSGERKTCNELLAAVAAKEVELKALEGDAVQPGYLSLFQMDRDVDNAFRREQRFAASFQYLVVSGTESKRELANAQMRDMLAETGYQNLTAETVARWTDQDKGEFCAKVQMYLDGKKQHELDQEKKRLAEEEGRKERERLLREEEERQKREAEDAQLAQLDAATRAKEEEDRRRLAAQEAEVKQRKQDEDGRRAAEAARLKEEQDRLAEDKRKAEAAKKAREDAARKKAEEDARRKAEDDARRAEEAQRLADEEARAEHERQEEERKAREAEEQREREAEEEREREEAEHAAEELRAREAALQAAREQEEARKKAEAQAQAAEAKRLADEKAAAEERKKKRKADQGGSAAAQPQTVQELITSLNGAKYTDTAFPPTFASLYKDHKVPAAGNGRVKGWKNITDFAKEGENAAVRVFDDTINADDIEQGGLGDCWFLAATAVLAERPLLLRKVFVNPEVNASGVYALQLYKRGRELTTITIDDNFPSEERAYPAYGHSRNAGEMWVMLLEKAYAKLYGSYEAMDGGQSSDAFRDFTGFPADSIQVNKSPDIASGRLWKRILSYQAAGFLMACGSHAGSDADVNKKGIVQGHAFSILNVVETDGLQMMKIRNPWGTQEWNGDYSDKSKKWTARLKAKLGYDDKDDGAWWMTFADFALQYERLYVCYMFGDSASIARYNGVWEAAGEYDYVKVENQYLVTASRPSLVVVWLFQNEETSSGSTDFLIVVLNNEGKKCEEMPDLSGANVLGKASIYSGDYEEKVEVTLPPSSTPYTVVLVNYEPTKRYTYDLKICSSDPITVSPAP